MLVLAGCAGKATTTSSTPSTGSPPTTQASTTSTIETVTSTTEASTSTSEATTATTGTAVTEGGTTYTAELSGKDVVPPVETSATGVAIFTVDPSGTHVRFSLQVNNIADATASRVRQGEPGSSGQGVLILFAGPTRAGVFSGTLASGSFDESAFIGPLRGKTIADFVALVTSGQLYVSVGTVKNPNGEIRGQIQSGESPPAESTTTSTEG